MLGRVALAAQGLLKARPRSNGQRDITFLMVGFYHFTGMIRMACFVPPNMTNGRCVFGSV
jgi:hypothetical protein